MPTITPKTLEERYEKAEIRTGSRQTVIVVANKIVASRNRYQAVAEKVNVHWTVIGIIHYLESNCNFSTHLHNGDPLTERTTHVPAGRPKLGTPPFTWEYSAIDALTGDRIDCSTLGNLLDSLERYNGLGYRTGSGQQTTPPSTSPYLWSFTDQYVKGKYVADGKFDPTAVSAQVGAVALLKMLSEMGYGIRFSDGPATPEPVGEQVGWFEAHLLIDPVTRIAEVGIAAKQADSDKTLATARFSIETELQRGFLEQFPNARSIVRAPLDKPWPGEEVTDRWQHPPFTEVRVFNRGADIQLSKNFHLSEFECRCGCRTTKISGKHIQQLQKFRDKIGKPIQVNSGYRCEKHNKAVGGATDSQHLTGNASDIGVKDLSPSEVYAEADKMFNGVGKYVGFTHVDSRDKKARW